MTHDYIYASLFCLKEGKLTVDILNKKNHYIIIFALSLTFHDKAKIFCDNHYATVYHFWQGVVYSRPARSLERVMPHIHVLHHYVTTEIAVSVTKELKKMC